MTPHPGNELSILIMQSDFKNVASNYPAFTSHCIQTISRLELEQQWSKTRMLEAIKERRKKMEPRTKPPLPPVPAQ